MQRLNQIISMIVRSMQQISQGEPVEDAVARLNVLRIYEDNYSTLKEVSTPENFVATLIVGAVAEHQPNKSSSAFADDVDTVASLLRSNCPQRSEVLDK